MTFNNQTWVSYNCMSLFVKQGEVTRPTCTYERIRMCSNATNSNARDSLGVLSFKLIMLRVLCVFDVHVYAHGTRAVERRCDLRHVYLWRKCNRSPIRGATLYRLMHRATPAYRLSCIPFSSRILVATREDCLHLKIYAPQNVSFLTHHHKNYHYFFRPSYM